MQPIRIIIIKLVYKLVIRWVLKYVIDHPCNCKVKVDISLVDLIFGHDNGKDKSDGKRK